MVDATLRALARLRAHDASRLGQGLSPENAQACLHQSIRPLNRESLMAAVERAHPLPKSIAIVVPYGVFTTPIEWTAIAVAGGATVHLKAPAMDASLVKTMADVFSEEGLPVRWSIERTLPPVEAIVAFGSDESVAGLRAANPHVSFAGYGHKFSLAYVGGDPAVAARTLAMDVVRYDGRGCMAPVAVFCSSDCTELAESMAESLRHGESVWPRGTVDPALGPEWRRRMGLGRVMGQVWGGPQWAVTVTPVEYFTPSSLPRMVNIHPVQGVEHLSQCLEPWRPSLSTLGTDISDVNLPGVHRFCRLGWMQAPTIPREHDGRLMLGGLHSTTNGDDGCG